MVVALHVPSQSCVNLDLLLQRSSGEVAAYVLDPHISSRIPRGS